MKAVPRFRKYATVLMLALTIFLPTLLVQTHASPTTKGPLVIVYLKVTVDEGLVYTVQRAAVAAKGGTLILVVDSYGGYLRSMDKIVETLSSCPCRTVAWIPSGSKAVSAAAVIALSAEKLYVGKGAVLGACHPWPADEKVLSYMAKKIESLLVKRKVKDAERIAIGMVYNNTTLDYEEMVKLGVADGVADTLDVLLTNLGLKGIPAEIYGRDVVSDLISFLFDPGTALMFIVLGVLLAMLGIKTGGHHGFLLTGLALLALAFYSLDIIGGSLLTFTLLTLGLTALILELKKPGLQIFGALGLTLIFLAVIFEYYRRPYVEFGLNLLPLVASFIIIAGFLLFVIVKASAALKMHVTSLEEKLVGKRGRVKTKISPGKPGIVNVESEDWSAISEEEIEAGEEVEVIGVEGLTLRVKRFKNKQSLS